MIYAYVQNGVVLEVERRTKNGYQIHELYHGSLVPFFIPVPEEIAPHIRKGWVYSHAEGFHEPQPFEINPETGEMYLPAGIPAEVFWNTLQENIHLQSEQAKQAEEIIQAQQEITEQELISIEHGQQMTDLELMVLGGGANV